MKDAQSLTRKGTSSLRLAAAVAVVCLGIVWQSQGQGAPVPILVTLNDANSSAQIAANTQQGMFNWTVDGINQLNQQWFWYRIGTTGPEASINSISAPAITQPGANVATISYANALFSVSSTYTLRGGLAGSGASDIGESVVINNLSGAVLNLHFFQYSDFSLGGTPQNDFTALSRSMITGLYNEAAVWDANLVLTENVDTTASPGANHGEVAPIGVTLISLNDGSPTTLSDVAGPLGPGHYTWAFEWDLNIAVGDSIIISKDKNIQAALIPEPSALGLVLVGLGVFCRRMSRRCA